MRALLWYQRKTKDRDVAHQLFVAPYDLYLSKDITSGYEPNHIHQGIPAFGEGILPELSDALDLLAKFSNVVRAPSPEN